jgi:iron complex outermembrane receptor protein
MKTWFLLAGASVLVAMPATAQQTDGGFEEIIVTALRTDSVLQQTPIAITALTRSALANKQILNTQDIANAVPGLTLIPVTANPSTFQIGLRGGSEQTSGLIVSEPVVGIYVDDVYRGRMQGSNFQLTDIERVEVLRGPQGTLYGRNTFSGALKIITRTPGQNDSWLKGSIGYGSFDEIRGDISMGGVVAGDLGASMSVFYRDQGSGWIFNRATGQDVGAERNFAARAKLAYDSGPLRVIGSVSYTDDVNDGYIPVNVQFTPPPTTPPVGFSSQLDGSTAGPVVPGNPYVTSSPTPSRGETSVFTGTLDIALDVGAVTLRSITGYVDTTDFFRWDLAGGQQVGPNAFISTFDRASQSDAQQWSQELQATGSLLDDKLNFVAGLFYFNETGNQNFNDAFFGFVTPLFRQRTKTESYAAFAQANYAFTDSTSITLGARYTTDKKDFSADIAAPSNVTADLDATFNAFTPKFGIEQKFSEDVLGYVSVSKGFKAGGFNGLSRAPAVLNTVYQPQTVWAYEAGVKAELLNRRLRTNLAVFINDISDLQQTAQRGTDFPQLNVGDARVWGVELEVSARPFKGLDLNGSISYNNDSYKSLIPGADAATSGAQRLPLVSEWQARLGGTFEQPLDDTLLFRIGGNMNYTGSYFPVVTNAILLPGWTRIDAFVALATLDNKWELNLSGQNLTDEVTYVSGIISPPFQPALTPLRPRTWMVSLKFNY